MRHCSKTLALFLALAVLQFVLGTGHAQVAAHVQTNGSTNIDLPTNGEVEQEIADKSDKGTQSLIKTLTAIESQNIFYICTTGNFTEEERMSAPLMHDTFEKLVNELTVRGGESVRQAFKNVLLEEKLNSNDKKLVRNLFQKEWHEDIPFTLALADRTQTRQLLLRFDPGKVTSVNIKKGDTLLPIARKAYPKLSQWDAEEALVFINGLADTEMLHPNQMLNIYGYELIKDSPADWTLSGNSNK